MGLLVIDNVLINRLFAAAGKEQYLIMLIIQRIKRAWFIVEIADFNNK